MPFGFVSSAIDGGFSMASARQQRKHTEKMYKHRYQWAMDDAKKAGLNPMLVMGHGPGSAGSSAQAAPISTARNRQASAQAQVAKEAVNTAKTEQERNRAMAAQHAAQERVLRQQERSATIDADQKALSHRHWNDPRSGAALSFSRAQTEAGLSPGVRDVGGIGFGLGQAFRQWLGGSSAKDNAKSEKPKPKPKSKPKRKPPKRKPMSKANRKAAERAAIRSY